MSKKSSVNKSKKSGRRLKRSVRRTLAAVLMITAIGVAAIPVPENFATETTPTASGNSTGTTTESVGDVHDMKGFGYVEGYTDEDIKINSGGKLPLNLFADSTVDEMLAKLKDSDEEDDGDLSGYVDEKGNPKKDAKPDVYASYTIRYVDDHLSLIWEFLYYLGIEGDSKRGVVCKYNDDFATDSVSLSSLPITSFYTVPKDEFQAVYNATAAKHEDAVKQLNDNFDPTETIEFTYDDYEEYKLSGDKPSDGSITTAQWNFLNNADYAKADFEAACAKFEAYSQYLKDKQTNPDAEEPETGKSALTVTPADTKYLGSISLQYKFYCEHHKELSKLSSDGFTLVEVYDGRPKSSGGYIYVVQYTKDVKPGENLGFTLADKYLVKNQSTYEMRAIGEKAFAKIDNVKNMKVPSMIRYIGNEAFAGAGLIEEIDLGNTIQIGNRAFKGCTNLSKVTLAQGTSQIGAECFYKTAISTIDLPKSITKISYGAFANCTHLTSIDFSKLTNAAEIGDYAFYGCTALQEVDMTNASIASIGTGAFAADAGVLDKFIFPQIVETGIMDDPKSIGDYMFAGRSSLKTVIFPKYYGTSSLIKDVTLPDNMFHGCIGLEYVEFPADSGSPYAGGFVNYTPGKLFKDVRGSILCVRGPAEKSGTSADRTANPRKSTWDAETDEPDYPVPYLYTANGKEYYEVCRGDYLLCIQKNADGQTGVLTSCKLKPGSVQSGDEPLVIPSRVGDTKVVSIASDCFTDENLNNNVETLIIEDDSISTIADSVFKGWPNLKEVQIGNSVTSIGKEAFANCNKLVDVTFNSPMNGNHAGFTIGTDAFKTGSTILTFHGDIVKGYAPFEWAMNPNNIIKQPEGIRVCYKSLAPTYLTVMYNPNTELVTLLDYPKSDQVSAVLTEAHKREITKAGFTTYARWMERLSYDKYKDSYYDPNRKAFQTAWRDALTPEAQDAVYQSDSYGPWVNPEFCSEWKTWVPASEKTDSGNTGGDGEGEGEDVTILNKLADWLFEPIVAYASETGTNTSTPKAYYSYANNGYDPVKYSEMTNRKPWQTTTSEEAALINATKEIVVPAGVDSIDVYGYYNNLDRDGNELKVIEDDNRLNVEQYLDPITAQSKSTRWDSETFNMYTTPGLKMDDKDNLNSVPGLFSGTYKDYDTENDNEQRERGNDRIISVTLNSVKYLPKYAFDSCEQLTTVILGPDCANIGIAPFRGCHSLKAVGDNDYYKTNNGIVYSVNSDGSYTIEECLWARGLAGGVGEARVSLSTDENLGMVSKIKDGAFEDCDNITVVDLTNTAGLVDIPDRCFKNCDNLNRIWLPGTVNSIGEEAFVGANQLSDLQIPGKEVFISGNAFDTNKLATTTVHTSEDSSAKRYVDTYGKQYKLEWEKADNWRVVFLDADLQQIGKEQTIKDGEYAEVPEDPVKEDWVFDRWLGTNNTDPRKDPIHADTMFVAVGYSTSSMVDGKYVVDFMDQVDGTIFSTQLVEPGKDAIIPQAPVHAGYTFLKYGGDSLTNIQKNSVALAMYSGGTGVNGGGDTTSGSSSSTQTSSNSVSGNSTSSTSTGAGSVGKYTVTVINGSGSGTYDAGSTVIIAANTPATGKVFKNWTTESPGVTLASVSLSATTFVMPNNNVTVTANYVTGSSNTLTGVSTNGNTGNGNNGNTRVDITKPGISNKDLATAKVNGSTDNFVVKISETPEATQAVMNALTNKYGNLDSVLYYAMDISLYDSTGTVKISDTTGLTVDITIPIPDALTVFGGNNMAGAVVANDQLEELSERFSTINGVPCISFTATHFSPYTVYVNTQQLSDGALDITPKTGDPIHPKWFLSLGLACMSIILFMKKDKKPVKVRAN